MFAEENWEYRFKAHFDNSGVPWQCLWISKGSQQKVKSVSNGDDKGKTRSKSQLNSNTKNALHDVMRPSSSARVKKGKNHT